MKHFDTSRDLAFTLNPGWEKTMFIRGHGIVVQKVLINQQKRYKRDLDLAQKCGVDDTMVGNRIWVGPGVESAGIEAHGFMHDEG